MGWMERVKNALDRAADTLEDVQESGLAENAGKLLKSVSKVMERYAPGEEKKEPGQGDQ